MIPLTAKRKAAIVERFKKGESVGIIAGWYEQPPKRIEGVIRDALILSANKLDSIAALNEMKTGVEKQANE